MCLIVDNLCDVKYIVVNEYGCITMMLRKGDREQIILTSSK